ncbi:hypothetical protein GSI_05299 [Ganoderma sinense ZZ0214-1]|uniref:Uncharacterized protein n=1 Tax=Ganoderma sinense ZZ0214-1 TaxID=1077348 RepID=A0A2G8SFQ7_9APHY|nr:hypothetical protein GSI_05299 [Ganoderma sinense ZZ0214-1]
MCESMNLYRCLNGPKRENRDFMETLKIKQRRVMSVSDLDVHVALQPRHLIHIHLRKVLMHPKLLLHGVLGCRSRLHHDHLLDALQWLRLRRHPRIGLLTSFRRALLTNPVEH